MRNGAAETILRWGISFVFFYAGIDALIEPRSWLGYMPGFIAQPHPGTLLLTVFAVYEVALAVWLFTGRRLQWSSMFATVTLGVAAFLGFSAFIVTFRDVGLAFAALALFELAKGRGAKADEGPAGAEEELL